MTTTIPIRTVSPVVRILTRRFGMLKAAPCTIEQRMVIGGTTPDRDVDRLRRELDNAQTKLAKMTDLATQRRDTILQKNEVIKKLRGQ